MLYTVQHLVACTSSNQSADLAEGLPGVYRSHPLPTPWFAPNLTNPPPGLHMPCQNKTTWHAIWCRGKTNICAHPLYLYIFQNPPPVANLAVNPCLHELVHTSYHIGKAPSKPGYRTVTVNENMPIYGDGDQVSLYNV